MQYIKDKRRFRRLFEDVFDIDIKQLDQFLATRNIAEIFVTPELITDQQASLDKLYAFRDLMNTYQQLALYDQRYHITTHSDVVRYMFHHLKDVNDKEYFGVAYLNTKNRLLGFDIVSEGTLNQTLVHPRGAYRGAIKHNASAIVIVHNHPSGTVEPSVEDRHLTDRIKKAGQIIGIRCLDHIIVGGNQYYSLEAEEICDVPTYRCADDDMLNAIKETHLELKHCETEENTRGQSMTMG